MTEQTNALPVLVLVRDLLFGTRIRSAAEDLGVAVKMVREPAKLAAEAGSKLVVDLNLDGAIPAAMDWKAKAHRPVVGFVSHADTRTIDAARQAGIDRVMARSRFVQTLGEVLS
jgi:hypothetical protein